MANRNLPFFVLYAESSGIMSRGIHLRDRAHSVTFLRMIAILPLLVLAFIVIQGTYCNMASLLSVARMGGFVAKYCIKIFLIKSSFEKASEESLFSR